MTMRNWLQNGLLFVLVLVLSSCGQSSSTTTNQTLNSASNKSSDVSGTKETSNAAMNDETTASSEEVAGLDAEIEGENTSTDEMTNSDTDLEDLSASDTNQETSMDETQSEPETDVSSDQSSPFLENASSETTTQFSWNNPGGLPTDENTQESAETPVPQDLAADNSGTQEEISNERLSDNPDESLTKSIVTEEPVQDEAKTDETSTETYTAANRSDTLMETEARSSTLGNRGYVVGSSETVSPSSNNISEENAPVVQQAKSDIEPKYRRSPLYRPLAEDNAAAQKEAQTEQTAMTNSERREPEQIEIQQPPTPTTAEVKPGQPSFNGEVLFMNVAANQIMVKDPDTNITRTFKAKDKSLLSNVKEGELVSVIFDRSDNAIAQDIIVR